MGTFLSSLRAESNVAKTNTTTAGITIGDEPQTTNKNNNELNHFFENVRNKKNVWRQFFFSFVEQILKSENQNYSLLDAPEQAHIDPKMCKKFLEANRIGLAPHFSNFLSIIEEHQLNKWRKGFEEFVGVRTRESVANIRNKIKGVPNISSLQLLRLLKKYIHEKRKIAATAITSSPQKGSTVSFVVGSNAPSSATSTASASTSIDSATASESVQQFYEYLEADIDVYIDDTLQNEKKSNSMTHHSELCTFEEALPEIINLLREIKSSEEQDLKAIRSLRVYVTKRFSNKGSEGENVDLHMLMSDIQEDGQLTPKEKQNLKDLISRIMYAREHSQLEPGRVVAIRHSIAPSDALVPRVGANAETSQELDLNAEDSEPVVQVSYKDEEEEIALSLKRFEVLQQELRELLNLSSSKAQVFKLLDESLQSDASKHRTGVETLQKLSDDDIELLEMNNLVQNTFVRQGGHLSKQSLQFVMSRILHSALSIENLYITIRHQEPTRNELIQEYETALSSLGYEDYFLSSYVCFSSKFLCIISASSAVPSSSSSIFIMHECTSERISISSVDQLVQNEQFMKLVWHMRMQVKKLHQLAIQTKNPAELSGPLFIYGIFQANTEVWLLRMKIQIDLHRMKQFKCILEISPGLDLSNFRDFTVFYLTLQDIAKYEIRTLVRFLGNAYEMNEKKRVFSDLHGSHSPPAATTSPAAAAASTSTAINGDDLQPLAKKSRLSYAPAPPTTSSASSSAQQ